MYARLGWNILDRCALCIVLRVMKLHHALVLMGWSSYIGEFFFPSEKSVSCSSFLHAIHHTRPVKHILLLYPRGPQHLFPITEVAGTLLAGLSMDDVTGVLCVFVVATRPDLAIPWSFQLQGLQGRQVKSPPITIRWV